MLTKKGEIRVKKGEMEKIFELTKELRVRDIDMIFLQETRREEQNSVINGYRVIMSGATKGKRGANWHGTGVIMKEEIYQNCVIAVEEISQNIQNIYMMMTEDRVMKFTNVYKTIDENKEQWEQIEKEWREKTDKKQENITVGDFNAKIGKKNRDGEEKKIDGIGKYRIHEHSDKFGKKLEELVEEYDMNIMNTIMGKEGEEHTFQRGEIKTQIDYVIADEEARRKIKKIEVQKENLLQKEGATHRPIQIEMYLNDYKKEKKEEEETKIDYDREEIKFFAAEKAKERAREKTIEMKQNKEETLKRIIEENETPETEEQKEIHKCI